MEILQEAIQKQITDDIREKYVKAYWDFHKQIEADHDRIVANRLADWEASMDAKIDAKLSNRLKAFLGEK